MLTFMSAARFLAELTTRKGRSGIRRIIFEDTKEPWVGPRQTFPHELVVYCESGILDARIGDSRDVEVAAGAVLWLPAGVSKRFSRRPGNGGRSYRLHVRVGSGQCGVSPCADARVWSGCQQLGASFRALTDMPQQPSGLGGYAVNAHSSLIAANLFSRPDRAGESIPKLAPAVTARMFERLRSDLAGGVTPTDLARAAGLSPDYFTRVFRRQFGVSPRAYIQSERMRVAAQLAEETNLSSSEIANQIGASNQPLFCRQFKAAHGVTVMEKRRQFMQRAGATGFKVDRAYSS